MCLREVIPVYLRTVSSNWFNKLPCFYKAVQTNYVILAGLCLMIQHRPREVLYLCSSKNCGTSTCKSAFKSRLWMLGSLPVTASLSLSVFNNTEDSSLEMSECIFCLRGQKLTIQQEFLQEQQWRELLPRLENNCRLGKLESTTLERTTAFCVFLLQAAMITDKIQTTTIP